MDKEIARLSSQHEWLAAKLSNSLTAEEAAGQGRFAGIELNHLLSLSPADLQQNVDNISTSLHMVSDRASEEKERRAKWKLENQRRRHNYVPLIFELLKQLAQKNMLEDL